MNSEFTIAVHSLVLLAHRPERMATSEMIATNVSTHSARIRKVMGLLRNAGYVRTKEGIGGGFILDCDPAKVTLGQIYRVTSQGTLKPSWCCGDQSVDCQISSNMQGMMDQLFQNAEEHLAEYLDSETIDTVYNKIKSKYTEECSANSQSD